jgi:hypothetical protein
MQPASQYDRPTIWFHWTIAVLVPLQWGIAQIIDLFPQVAADRGAVGAYQPRIVDRALARDINLLAGNAGTRASASH